MTSAYYSHSLPDGFISTLIRQHFVKKGDFSYSQFNDVSAYDKQCSIIACGNDRQKLNLHHHIRYLGFCEERNMDPNATIVDKNGLKCEIDEFDAFADHYLIKDHKTDAFFGAFRKFRFKSPESLPGVIRSEQQEKLQFKPQTVAVSQFITPSKDKQYFRPLSVEFQTRSMLEVSRFVLSKTLRTSYGISSESFASTTRLIMADAFTQAAKKADDLMIFTNEAMIKRLKKLNIESYAQQPPVKAYGNRLTCLFDKCNFEQFVQMSPDYMNEFRSVVDITKNSKRNEDHYLMLRIMLMNLETNALKCAAQKRPPIDSTHQDNIQGFLGTAYPEFLAEKYESFL